jgi:hypothetical protein
MANRENVTGSAIQGLPVDEKFSQIIDIEWRGAIEIAFPNTTFRVAPNGFIPISATSDDGNVRSKMTLTCTVLRAWTAPLPKEVLMEDKPSAKRPVYRAWRELPNAAMRVRPRHEQCRNANKLLVVHRRKFQGSGWRRSWLQSHGRIDRPGA